MSSESEARAALRSLGYRLSGYKGGFTILDAEQTYVTLDDEGRAADSLWKRSPRGFQSFGNRAGRSRIAGLCHASAC